MPATASPSDSKRLVRTPATDTTVHTIQPPRRWPGLGLRELWSMRRVGWVLARRQFNARYSNMALGVGWVLLEPLLMTIIVSVLLTAVLGRGDRYGLPFPAFIFPGWIAFGVFNRVVNQGGGSIRSNAPLVGRIYLPRAFFPLSVALVSFVDFVFMAIALFALLLWYGILPGAGMLMLPILLAILYAFCLGGAFVFAAGSMRVPDVDFVRAVVVRAWFWLSPVIYASTIVPEGLRTFYYLNPMVVVIEGFRWAFTQSPMPPPEAWVIGASSAGVLLVWGYVYFRRQQPYFADLL